MVTIAARRPARHAARRPARRLAPRPACRAARHIVFNVVLLTKHLYFSFELSGFAEDTMHIYVF